MAKELISSSWALRWPTDTRRPSAYLLCHSMSVTSQCRIVLKNLSPENLKILLTCLVLLKMIIFKMCLKKKALLFQLLTVKKKIPPSSY